MTHQPVRWGILSTGRIASVFAEALQSIDDAHLVAVGSRSADSAAVFGERFNVPRRYASYEELAADPDVDIIYIATPHALHYENCLLCLNHGKAVLCEKPFTINARQAAEVVAVARERGLFLMEAMWTRFLPAIVRLRELLAQGVIGEVRMIALTSAFALASIRRAVCSIRRLAAGVCSMWGSTPFHWHRWCWVVNRSVWRLSPILDLPASMSRRR